MNTTEIIAKLRAQAAELTTMADALDANSNEPRKVGDWAVWENAPAMSLLEDLLGDIVFKGDGYGEWVGIDVRTTNPTWCSATRCCRFAQPATPGSERFRVAAVNLRGDETRHEVQALWERFKASQVPA